MDGDTYQLRVDLGFRVALSINGRLRGVDTPEMNTPEGKAAKVFAEKLLMGNQILIQSYHDRMTFARWVVDVWLPDGQSLAERLISEGQGKPM